VSDQWYYAWRGEKIGPYSGLQLQELAQAGKIQPTDTIWQEGTTLGVPATRVKNLFARNAGGENTQSGETAAQPAAPPRDANPPRSASVSAVEAPDPLSDLPPETDFTRASAGSPELSAAEDLQMSEVATAPTAAPPDAPPKPKKGHAVALRGAVVVSQDGTSVQYRKKCSKCGHEDASKNRMPIRNGITRVNFFCPKCRKMLPVEIQGTGK